MDISKFDRLRRARIDKPCPEDWDKMEGDEKRRFCLGCGKYVDNVANLGVEEAEELLARGEQVCVRMSTDSQKGILTRDGWIPRILLAGAFVASAGGCATTTGEIAINTNAPVTQEAENQTVANRTTEAGKNNQKYHAVTGYMEGSKMVVGMPALSDEKRVDPKMKKK